MSDTAENISDMPVQTRGRGTPLGSLRDEIRAEAAALLAEGELTVAQIAQRVNVHVRTLWEWKQEPSFVEMVLRLRCSPSSQFEIGLPRQRLATMDARYQRLKRIMEERAADPEYANEPGGKTGLLMKVTRARGKTTTVEYRVDHDLLDAFLRLEKQAAQECGQWQEHSTTPHSAAPQISITNIRVLADSAEPLTLNATPIDPPLG